MKIRRNRPPLAWNEIRARARRFAAKWEGAARERGEAQTFWNEFFEVFDMSRRRVAQFEKEVTKAGNRRGFMDLFWPGMLLVEHKSAGGDLDEAQRQGMGYFSGIAEEDLPKYVITCDFARFHLYDADTRESKRFALADLPDNAELFGFIAGYEKQEFRNEDPVNIRAAELMAGVFDALNEGGYRGDGAMFLVRALFCLFAEDTGIFERGLFESFIRERTAKDGSDLGSRLAHLFQVLNTPPKERARMTDEFLLKFPYINGDLFGEKMDIPGTDSALREKILHACAFNWSEISPAVFGSLFQHVMNKDERRKMGRHYTTEENILKVTEPLFMEKLRAEFARAKESKSKKRLESFHRRIAALTFLDPACGCGNFLIVAYRELRRLEIEVLRAIYPKGTRAFKGLNVGALCRIDVDSFYGMELNDFSRQVAEVALWLTDHQMNREVSREFGDDYRRIPLKKSPHIHCVNALTADWRKIVAPEKLSHILGNPPFVGQAWRNAEQRAEMEELFDGVQGAGNLDYVAAWYLKAARYIKGTDITCAFVSTNSIVQGEQVAPLWRALQPEGVRVHFAHRTFAWTSEARGAAHVHVIIVGFGVEDTAQKFIYEYDTLKSAPHKMAAVNINGYLVDAANVSVEGCSKPLSSAPEIIRGNGPVDDGNFLFTPEEKEEFLRREPAAEKFLHRFLGSREFINDIERWCLWLTNATPKELRQMPAVMERVEKVRHYRNASKRKQTLKAAAQPALFAEIRQPETDYLLIPRVSSENRQYIPVGYMPANVIVSDGAVTVPNATPYEFGIITSAMHMAWMRTVASRLKSDYRYSHQVVYNTFPWPSPTATQKSKITECAKAVLVARKNHGDSSLADLYDPDAMPPDLLKAHQSLDKAVDRAYRAAPFKGERARLEYLFAAYQKLSQPIVAPLRKRRAATKRRG